MEPLLRLLAENIANRIASGVKAGVAPLGPYLRRLSLGVLMVLLSAPLWFTGVLFLLVSLYLSTSHLGSFMVPGLWTAGACFLVALVLTGVGMGMLRPPR
jgi:hypothetical protein